MNSTFSIKRSVLIFEFETQKKKVSKEQTGGEGVKGIKITSNRANCVRWPRFCFAFDNGLVLTLVEKCQKPQSLYGPGACEGRQGVSSNSTKHVAQF